MNTAFTASIEKIETRADGTLKISLGSQELSKEAEIALFSMRRQGICRTLLSTNDIPESILETVENIPLEKVEGKSQSQRLRAVLFRLWEQEQPPSTADEYYHFKMNQLIDHFKSKLDELPKV